MSNGGELRVMWGERVGAAFPPACDAPPCPNLRIREKSWALSVVLPFTQGLKYPSTPGIPIQN